jgi:hypothetical protein
MEASTSGAEQVINPSRDDETQRECQQQQDDEFLIHGSGNTPENATLVTRKPEGLAQASLWSKECYMTFASQHEWMRE